RVAHPAADASGQRGDAGVADLCRQLRTALTLLQRLLQLGVAVEPGQAGPDPGDERRLVRLGIDSFRVAREGPGHAALVRVTQLVAYLPQWRLEVAGQDGYTVLGQVLVQLLVDRLGEQITPLLGLLEREIDLVGTVRVAHQAGHTQATGHPEVDRL